MVVITINREFINLLVSLMESKGVKVDQLSEATGINECSISKYRNGQAIPCEANIIKLVEHLNSPRLEYEWLRTSSIARKYLPDIKRHSPSSSLMNFEGKTQDVLDCMRTMKEIAWDNKIDEHEVVRWQPCRENMSELQKATLTVLLAEYEEAASGRTLTASRN